MAEIEIRLMTVEDVPAIDLVEAGSFAIPWSHDAFVKEVTENKCARYLVLCEDGTPVAYAGVWFVLDEAHVCNIAVHPDHRRQGIAEMLVSALVSDLKQQGSHSLTLEVRASNEAAIGLYEKLGFRQAGRRKNYYRNPREDALILRKEWVI